MRRRSDSFRLQGKEVGAGAPKPNEQVTAPAKLVAHQEAADGKLASPGSHSLHVEDASKGGAGQGGLTNHAPPPPSAEFQPIPLPVESGPAAEASQAGLHPLEAGPSGRDEPGQGAVDGRTPAAVEVTPLLPVCVW